MMNMRLLALTCLSTGAVALDTFQYGAFLPTATYSVANQLGFFAAYGLNVVYNTVPNSVAAFSSLLSGDYDLLTATVDNALNYRFNQKSNVTVLGQLDQGPDLVVAATHNITDFEQLRGLPIMVDSPLSGYAYLLRAVLSEHGLELGTDYYFMTVGGTGTRYAALTSGALTNGSTAYATILNYPFTVQSQNLDDESQEPNILARVSDLVAPITSSAFTVSTDILADSGKADLLTRFLAAMYGANRYLLSTSSARKCIVKAIAAEVGISSDVAAQEVVSVLDSVTGEVSPGSNFTVNQEGIRNVADVRAEFGGFSGIDADTFDWTAALTPGSGQLIDYVLRDKAVRLFNSQPFYGNCTKSCRMRV